MLHFPIYCGISLHIMQSSWSWKNVVSLSNFINAFRGSTFFLAFSKQSNCHNPKFRGFDGVYIKITAAVSFFKISEKLVPACQRKQTFHYLH